MIKLKLLSLLVIFAGGISAFAQERGINHAEFSDYLRRAKTATKEISFRKKVSVDTSDLQDGVWKPYSAWIEVCVFPDRSHIFYSRPQVKEAVRIGRITYSREGRDPWARSEQPSGFSVNSPAGMFAYGPEAQFRLGSLGENAFIRVISKVWYEVPKGKEQKITTYLFDEKGILIKSESIAFNGRNWLRRIENYEYDPDIKIEAPIK